MSPFLALRVVGGDAHKSVAIRGLRTPRCKRWDPTCVQSSYPFQTPGTAPGTSLSYLHVEPRKYRAFPIKQCHDRAAALSRPFGRDI